MPAGVASCLLSLRVLGRGELLPGWFSKRLVSFRELIHLISQVSKNAVGSLVGEISSVLQGHLTPHLGVVNKHTGAIKVLVVRYLGLYRLKQWRVKSFL